VVEVAGEVVGEELLGGAELAARLARSGNNRRRLPPVGCSRRKMTAGELPLSIFTSRRRGQVLGAGGTR
jgi:hypothetical protein